MVRHSKMLSVGMAMKMKTGSMAMFDGQS